MIDLLSKKGMIVQEVAADGNCQFAAISKQLERFGVESSAAKVRKEIVEHIRANPNLVSNN